MGKTEEYIKQLKSENAILRAELTEMREANRWIAVNEKLPPFELEVEIYRSKRYGKERYTHGALVDDSFDGLLWYAGYGGVEIDFEDVTHWRPLPEPPENAL